jgi:polysaccharide biosynthesis transport protein
VANTAPPLNADLRSYLSILWRRKLVILPFVVIVPVVAYLLQSGKPPVYQASADVLLSRASLSNSIAGIEDPNIWQPERDARNQVEVARAPELAADVVEALDLEDWTAQDLLDASSVTPGEDTDLLQFTIASRDRDLAMRLATEYASLYIDYRLELDTRALQQALRALAEKLRETVRGTPLHTSILEKQQQLETAAALQTANAVLIHPATSATQIEPRPKRSAVLGLLAGIVLGLGFAFVRDALDLRVRSADEAADLLDLPLLGKLPRPSFVARRGVIMLAWPGRADAEPYRILRSNLEFVSMDRTLRSIMVTSAVSGEGKSTAAANLAVSFALAGKKTILVDLDLRRPSVARFFELEEQPGITDVALGWIDLEAALRHISLHPSRTSAKQLEGRNGSKDVGTLHVLPAGSLPPNLGEFATTDALARVIKKLHGRADILIVDSSPALQTSDALTLSSHVDALLVVARLGVLRRTMVRDLKRFLVSAPSRTLGIVVTGAPVESAYGYYAEQRRGRTEAVPAEDPKAEAPAKRVRRRA